MSIDASRFAETVIFLCAEAICVNAAGGPQGDGISIRTDFPGGNVLVESIEGDVVHVAPDLRGGRDWFYWCFEAHTDTTRRLSFVFPEKPMKFVSMQGPAVSRDQGKTWNWLGAEDATGSSLAYAFGPGRKMRF